MPKPLKVMIEVEEIAHGRLFRLLDGMAGVVSITPVSDGPKTGNVPKGQKQGGAQSVTCLILGALIATPGVGRAALAPVLESYGKKAASMPEAIARLKKAKHIASKGAGKSTTYSVTAAGKKHYDTACTVQPPEGT